jgi:RNA-directed DNA polymerase
LDAIETARKRCWEYDWAIDLDIKGFFDNLDHVWVMRFVERYTKSKGALMYIERWLKAPSQSEDGTLVERNKGTPQGGVISPLLANIFLHEVFDSWMKNEFSSTPFERYADDIVVHCKTENQAWFVRDSIRKRLAQFNLELHPEKTKIVYCKDSNRDENFPEQKFDFLGYTFKARQAKNNSGKFFDSFSPAISNNAKRTISLKMRGWHIHHQSDIELVDIAKAINPILRGWINYYGKFHKSVLYPVFNRFNYTLIRWVKTKYKKLHGYRKARNWLGQKAKEEPNLFAHWQMFGIKPSVV